MTSIGRYYIFGPTCTQKYDQEEYFEYSKFIGVDSENTVYFIHAVVQGKRLNENCEFGKKTESGM